MRYIHAWMMVVALCVWSIVATAENPFDRLLAPLPVLEGRVPTHYSGLEQAEAQRVQAMFEAASDYFTTQSGVTLPLQLALLGASERQRGTPSEVMQLSIPGVRRGSPYLAWIPVGRPHGVDALVAAVGRKTTALRALGMTEEQVAQRFVILLALHDIGHFYARATFPHQGGPPPGWLSEFVASYLASAFLSDHYPAEARIWRTVTATFLEHIQPKSKGMFDGDVHVGAMADTYMRYVGDLQTRVNEAHQREGPRFVQKLKAAWDENAAHDVESAMRLLELASPGFEQWAKLHHRIR